MWKVDIYLETDSTFQGNRELQSWHIGQIQRMCDQIDHIIE